MSKYRIVKNGLDEFFIEKLAYEDLPYRQCVNGCLQPLRKEKWVRIQHTYKILTIAIHDIKYFKADEEKIKLKEQIEVVYEE